jgi:formate hydrogenlyase subunit 3/multisubunit Na+/H+ antiporter MnhD subunit
MIGLPMLNGFVGEFIILSSTFAGVSRPWAVAAALGIILGAVYMLTLVQRIFYGPESALTASKPADDLHLGEIAILTPLVVLMLVMGLAPNLWLGTIRTGVHPPPQPSPAAQTSVILSDRNASVAKRQGVEGPATNAVILSDRRAAEGVEGPVVAFSPAIPPDHLAQTHPEAQR